MSEKAREAAYERLLGHRAMREYERLLGHRAMREREAAKSDANAVIESYLAALRADDAVVERVAKAIGARHEAGYELGAMYSHNMRELARAALSAMWDAAPDSEVK